MVPVNFQHVRLAQQLRKLVESHSPNCVAHKHNKWRQILVREDFPPKLRYSENAGFKFSVNNEGEDVNKKPRSRRNMMSTAKATPTITDRGTGDWNQRNYDRFTLSKTQIS